MGGGGEGAARAAGWSGFKAESLQALILGEGGSIATGGGWGRGFREADVLPREVTNATNLMEPQPQSLRKCPSPSSANTNGCRSRRLVSGRRACHLRGPRR